jgi:predicted small metal-binding protein
MSKQINCDCGFIVQTQTDNELVKHAQLHAKEIHNVDLTPEKALEMAKPVEARIDA